MKRFTTYLRMSQDDLNQEYCDACFRGDLEQLKYVLHSPELTKHGDIYYDDGDCFYWAYEKKHIEIVDYLLFEANYKFTDKLKKKCEKEKRFAWDELKFLFERRNLYLELKNLPDKPPKKSIKI